MSYTRIVVRRGTSTEWTTSNPILASGEFGFETNTGKFKVGNGMSNWTALQYFANANEITSSLIDSAPDALNTLNELAAALGDDENFASTVLGQIATKANINSPTFTGTVDFSNAVLSGVSLPINWVGTFSDAETYVENDMVHYQGSVYYATGPNLNNADGYFPTSAGADWELFASKGEQGDVGPQGAQGEQGESGLQYAAVNSVSASRSIVSSDAGKFLVVDSASEVIFTIDATTAFQVGQHCEISRYGAGAVRFSSSGVTLSSSLNRLSISDKYAVASLVCVAVDEYLLIGDLSA